MRPPHIAQAPPCTAKRIQTNVKSLIYKGGGACAGSVIFDHAAGANEHCLGVAWSARSSVRADFDGNIRSSTGQASSKCSKVRQHHREMLSAGAELRLVHGQSRCRSAGTAVTRTRQIE